MQELLSHSGDWLVKQNLVKDFRKKMGVTAHHLSLGGFVLAQQAHAVPVVVEE